MVNLVNTLLNHGKLGSILCSTIGNSGSILCWTIVNSGQYSAQTFETRVNTLLNHWKLGSILYSTIGNSGNYSAIPLETRVNTMLIHWKLGSILWNLCNFHASLHLSGTWRFSCNYKFVKHALSICAAIHHLFMNACYWYNNIVHKFRQYV